MPNVALTAWRHPALRIHQFKPDMHCCKRLCVIFDLDGTLVDSEGLGNQAFLDLIPDLTESAESLVTRYRGMKLAPIIADLETRIGAALPSDFEHRYRAQVSLLFARELKAIPGVREVLDLLPYAKCIASSGPMAKILQALEVSGLARYFGANIFSSYDVGSWKPEPQLFLHAAQQMGFRPRECVVVEDSDTGVEAARRAGMRALQYVPSPVRGNECRGVTFAKMEDLSRLLGELATTG